MNQRKKRGPKKTNMEYIHQSLDERQLYWIKNLISNDGYTIPQIASFIGITKQGLYHKLANYQGVTTMNPINYKEVNKNTPHYVIGEDADNSETTLNN